MAKYLKDSATITQRGVTITGDGEGTDGVLGIVKLNSEDRMNKKVDVICYWYVNLDHKTNDEKNPFHSFVFSIEGDDFDTYISKEPQEDESEKYLLMFHRAYKYITDKKALYELYVGDPDNAEYATYTKYAIFKDIVN